ncbi:MAG TPA: hypothetical protein VLD19_06175, partial [Chitinophagaceae bacterium]|nr:hypothetical protein [Chitinophagaceae bacterium]
KNLQLKYEPAIDKTVATYDDIGVGLSYKLIDGQLHIAAGDDVGASVANVSFGDVHYIVDPATGVMTKNILDRSGFDKSFIMQPSATLWFPGGFVIGLTYGRHFSNWHRATSVFERHY